MNSGSCHRSVYLDRDHAMLYFAPSFTGSVSESGYGAEIYLRIVKEVHVRLLIAKSRVAPLKSLSLPRLELCAAILLSNLLTYIAQIRGDSFAIDATFAWSDSTVAVQENTASVVWGHVGTKSNPADHCSRGLFLRELVECRLWWAGPDWLPDFRPRAEFGSASFDMTGETEQGSTAAFLSVEHTSPFALILDKFSSLDKICRVVAYSLRYISRSRGRPAPGTLAVDQLERHSALLELAKAVQAESFQTDLVSLQGRREVSKELRRLAPFLDSRRVFRVGGQLAHSGLSYDAKHPALLPNRHRLTELLIEHVHRENLHPGRRALQYLLAQQFWILGVQRAIKRTLS